MYTPFPGMCLESNIFIKAKNGVFIESNTRRYYNMNKQRGKAEGASCMHERSRGLDERPNMRKEPFCMLKACKMSGIRVFGAMRERRRREAARSLFINVRGKAEGASCSHERSRGLDEEVCPWK